MSNLVELKPCPFCGSKPMRIVTVTSFGKSWGSRKNVIAFGCVNKECPVKPQINANDENIAEKVDMFNRRTP